MPQKPTYKELEQRVWELEQAQIERESADETMQESEQRLKSVFDQHFQFMAILTPEGRVSDVNELALNAQYVRREDYIGKLFWESPAWRDLPEWQAIIQERIFEAQRIQGPLLTEDVYKIGDGATRYADVSCTAIRDKKGKVLYVVMQASDTTTRKQAEEALRRNEELLSAIYNTTGDVLFLLDVEKDGEYRFKTVNPAFLSTTGLKIESVVGRSVKEVIPAGSLDLVLSKYRQAIEEKITVRWEETSDYPSGKRTALVTIDPIFDADGLSQYLVGTVHDITERKRAEDALRESEEKFSNLVRSLTDWVWSIDIKGVHIYSNEAVEQLLGYKPEEVINNSAFPLMHPDSKPLARAAVEKAIEQKKGWAFLELKWIHKDGSTRYFESTSHADFDDRGNLIGFSGVDRDITDHRLSEKLLIESEQKFKQLFENAPLSYQSLDKNGNFIEINETWLRVLGYQKEEVIGKNFSDFLHPEWKAHFRTNFPRFKAVGEILGVEFEIKKKDESFILVSFHGKIGHAPDGSFKQTHCVFRDITEQKQMEDENTVLEAKLQQAQKMESIGTLAGGIAHDFNNVLSSIIGFTELALVDAKQGTTQEDNLQEVYTAGKRAKDLVWQILTFARQTDEPTKPIQINTIIKEVLKFIRSSIPTTIEIKQNIDSDSFIIGNPTQTHQIIMNLCTNAAHAIGESSGILEVTLKDVAIDKASTMYSEGLSPGDYIEIKVTDTGSGIPSDAISSIFEPYFTTKAPGEGTGMGLAVVKGIVEKNGGDITVTSRLGEGTAFSVYLPITKNQQVKHIYESEVLPTGTEQILVVDDEAPIAKMVSQSLNNLGYQVTTKTSSLEALELFREKPSNFDLVISDVTMPNMTGDKLASELMNIRPDIPVILCTGYSSMVSDETVSEIGIKEFAYKPIVNSDLAKMVRKVLDAAKDTD